MYTASWTVSWPSHNNFLLITLTHSIVSSCIPLPYEHFDPHFYFVFLSEVHQTCFSTLAAFVCISYLLTSARNLILSPPPSARNLILSPPSALSSLCVHAISSSPVSPSHLISVAKPLVLLLSTVLTGFGCLVITQIVQKYNMSIWRSRVWHNILQWWFVPMDSKSTHSCIVSVTLKQSSTPPLSVHPSISFFLSPFFSVSLFPQDSSLSS